MYKYKDQSGYPAAQSRASVPILTPWKYARKPNRQIRRGYSTEGSNTAVKASRLGQDAEHKGRMILAYIRRRGRMKGREREGG
jgi:hypothetical protein